MPKVDKAEYPYTLKGIKDAMAHSKRSGKSIEMSEHDKEFGIYAARALAGTMKKGGKIPKYYGGGRVPMMPGRRRMGQMGPRRMNPFAARALAGMMKKGGKVKK